MSQWESYKEPLLATISDSVIFAKATISSTAAADHLKRTGKRVTDDTLGTIIQLQNAEIVATHLGPRPSRIMLFVNRLKIIALDKSGMFGSPRPFDATSEFSRLLERLTALRVSNGSTSGDQHAGTLGKMSAVVPKQEGFTSVDNNPPGSQQLFSQLPSHYAPRDIDLRAIEEQSAGLHLLQDSTKIHEQTLHDNVNTRKAALLKMLRAKGTVKSLANDVTAPQEQLVEHSSLSNVTEARRNPPPALSEGLPVLQSRPQISDMAVAMGSSHCTRDRAGSGTSRTTKVRSRDTKISKDQQTLLDQEDSWLPANPGRRGPVAHIPIEILKEITQRVEQRASRESLKEALQISEQPLVKVEEFHLHDQPREEQASDSESHIHSDDWPSSPIPVPRELPPNSSMEMVGSSDNEKNHTNSQPLGDLSVGEFSIESNTVPLSPPKNSAASPIRSDDPQDGESTHSLCQADAGHVETKIEHLPPISGDEHIVNVSTTQSDLRNNAEPGTAIDQEASGSESDIEMTVPLNLHEESTPATDSNLTQIVPATAFEPQEPFVQIKRTPYGGGREYPAATQNERYFSIPEAISSPSKRRRIDELGTAQKIGLNGLGNDAPVVSSQSNHREHSPQFPRTRSPVETTTIQDTIVDQTIQRGTTRQDLSSRHQESTVNVSIYNQVQMSGPIANEKSNVIDQSEDTQSDRDYTTETPISSPRVSKRRKRHKSPFSLKVNQEEYPKEDPSVAARRYREEYFASRKHSRSMSHASLYEPVSDQAASPAGRDLEKSNLSRNARISSESEPIEREVPGTPHDQFHALRSTQNNRQSNNKRDEAVVSPVGKSLNEPSCDASSVGRASPSLASSLNRQIGPQMPVVESAEHSNLLLTQSIKSDLHNASIILEGPSSVDISQQTNLSGQAQSLPELMTPAMSVSELTPHATSLLNDVAKSQDKFLSPDVFVRFRSAYPDYLGTREHFIGMCRRIDQLLHADRMEHRSLWDDFIIRHKMDYPQYCQRCMDNAEDANPYERFYREEIEEPKYSKRIIQPATLAEILHPFQSTSATQGLGLSPREAELDSHNAEVGAQPIFQSGYSGHSTPAWHFGRRSSKQGVPPPSRSPYNSADHNGQRPGKIPASRILEERQGVGRSFSSEVGETIDLTGYQSSLPSSALNSPILGRSPKHPAKPSPRKIPWKENKHASNAGHNNRVHKDRDEDDHFLKTFNRTSKSNTTMSQINSHGRKEMPDDLRDESQASELPSGPQRKESRRTKPQISDPLGLQGQQSILSSPTRKARLKQTATTEDEWWRDDNTPFAEYRRLYQSIRPGNGNAWAREKVKVKVKDEGKGEGIREKKDKQPGAKQRELSWLGPKDVLSWRL